jgi:hypothetical protein
MPPGCPTSSRALLEMRRGEAAFFLERLSTTHGRPIEWRTTTVRGDRYNFISKFEVGCCPTARSNRQGMSDPVG